MASLKNIRIENRLNFILGGSVIIILLFISVFSVLYSHNAFSNIMNDNMTDEVDNLDNFINTEVENKKIALKAAIGLMSVIIDPQEIQVNTKNSQEMQALNIMTNEMTNVNVPQFIYKGQNLYADTLLVDKLAKILGGTVTIDQKVEGGFLSIATNITLPNGQRTLNGFIPDGSELGKKLAGTQVSISKANILGVNYISAYSPIIQNGEITGVIIAALEENNMDLLKQTFYAKKFLESGYAVLIDKSGKLLIHPNKDQEGTDISDEVFFKTLAGTQQKEGTLTYDYQGVKKMLFYKYNEALEAYIMVNVFSDEYNAIAKKAAVIFLIILIVSAFLFIVINRIIVNTVTKPLTKCVQFSNEIAYGNITASLDIEQNDELGQLAISLRTMIEKIREVILSVRTSSKVIVNAGQMVNEASQQLSNSSTEQASTVEEVSSTMEEMVSAIKENTDNAENTNQISIQAQQVMEMLYKESIKLAESVNTISSKISIINDIALQTNILSLNARVEAAKAGEEGKGFSVVAEEIRRLADVSKKAADEIINLSGNSLDIAVSTGERINDLMPRIKETTELISGISAASVQQYNGAEQVNFSMQQVNESIQSNAGSSEELASSAQQLNDEVNKMEELLSFFKIK